MKNGKYCSSKKAMKPLAVLLAMILLVGCAVGGTLAWLTAQTTEVKNTFTSAELFGDDGSFTLWEHQAEDADEDGRYTLNTTKVAANTYDILPGVNIPKDPTVDVVNLEEYAYLYIEVTGTLPEGLDYSIDATNWEQLAGYSGIWVYKGTEATNNVIAGKDTAKKSFTANILTQNQDGTAITVDGTYSGTADTGLTLNFKAYMVQATGNGANAADAWANTYGATTNP